MLAKFMKLKLIEHYAHVILVTPKYSQSMVFNVFMQTTDHMEVYLTIAAHFKHAANSFEVQ